MAGIPAGAVAVVGGLCYIVLKSKLVLQWAYFVSAIIQVFEADTKVLVVCKYQNEHMT